MISSRSFAKAQLGRAKQEAVLTGFIYQEKFRWCNEDIKTISYVNVETGSKVQQMVCDFLPECVVMLASCKGLVCCRSCLPCKKPFIYVCNPLNKEWIKLEWPRSISQYDRSMALALAFDFDPSKGFVDTFKLVRVEKVVEEVEEEDEEWDEVEGYFTFELYTSEKGEWRKSSEICQSYSKLVKNDGIYIGGVLHWLTDRDRVLTFDVEKELSWLVPVPVPGSEFSAVPEAIIGESEGRLHYVVVSEDGVHVWCLEDYFEFNWKIVCCKSLEEIEGEWPQFFMNLRTHVLERLNGPWVDPLAFKDGVLLMRVCSNLYLFDVKNNNMAKVCSFQDLKSKCMFNPTVLPHSSSLIPLSPA